MKTGRRQQVVTKICLIAKSLTLARIILAHATITRFAQFCQMAECVGKEEDATERKGQHELDSKGRAGRSQTLQSENIASKSTGSRNVPTVSVSSDASLVVMVSDVLRNSGEHVKDSFRRGKVMRGASRQLKSLYKKERDSRVYGRAYKRNPSIANSDASSSCYLNSDYESSSVGQSVGRGSTYDVVQAIMRGDDQQAETGSTESEGRKCSLSQYSRLLDPRTDPFAVREGVSMTWERVTLKVVRRENCTLCTSHL